MDITSVQLGKRFSRRSFLGGTAVGVGGLALLGPAVLTARGAIASGGRFDQGVASGMPGTNAITLWTQVDDFSGNDRVRLEVARDENMNRLVFDDTVDINADADNVAKRRVDGLDAGEEYFYRFYTEGAGSRRGRFRTARPEGSRENVRIGFFSCQEFISGYYHAHRDMADQDLDLVVCLGDYVYEKIYDSNPAPGRMDDTGEDGDVQSLDEYREKYRLYNSDPDLRRMRESAAMIAIWDDHEVEDNYADFLPGSQTPERRVRYEERQQNGYRAFFEQMPQMSFRKGEQRIYGSLPLGNAEVFLLDTRQYRENQPCDNDDNFTSQEECPPPEYNERRRTLLGDDQLKWLKRRLERTRARWKVVATQIMIMSLDVSPGDTPLNTDQWDGYGDERRELIDHIREEEIENVTFVTGDIHTFFAGNVHRSGREAGNGGPGENDEGPVFGDGPPRATEFVGGGITSKGIVDRAAQEECERVAAAAPADLQVRANNPHIRFSNQAYKGYAFLEAGRDLDVTYRAVREPREEEHREVFTLARFRVDGGESEPQVEITDDNSAQAECEGPLRTDADGPPVGLMGAAREEGR